MAVDAKAGTYPSLTVARPVVDEYEQQRLSDRQMKRRDLGRVIGEALFHLYGEKRTAQLALDSELMREEIAHYVERELAAAGYVVRYVGREAA